LKLRFPDVARGASHYESVYVVLTHPTRPQAAWIRTTVKHQPGGAVTGALWLTWFSEAGVRAGKLDDLPVHPGGLGVVVGDASQGPGGTRGRLAVAGLAATWEVEFISRAPSLEHLSPGWLYRSPVPRTKATSPVPDFEARGALVIDGTEIIVDGWTGMVGHNWGTEHADTWCWLRAGGLGPDGDGWLDAVLARVRVGPVRSPWTGFGVLAGADGRRERLGGLIRRGASVGIRPDGAEVVLTGAHLRVTTRATISLPTTVGWMYADPAGGVHEVVNSSVAAMSVDVERDGHSRQWTPQCRGVVEIGASRRAWEVPLQPFAD
jgi:hypothetical protein